MTKKWLLLRRNDISQKNISQIDVKPGASRGVHGVDSTCTNCDILILSVDRNYHLGYLGEVQWVDVILYAT